MILEFLTVKFQKFLKAMTEKDYASIKNMTEPRFYKELEAQKKNLDNYSLSFQPSENVQDSYVIDKMFIKGVKFNREENDSNIDYMYVDT